MKFFSSIDKITLISIVLIVFVGLVPLTWYRPSYTIIKMDNSPYWFNSPQTLSGDLNMWLGTGGSGHISRQPALAALFIPMFLLQLLGLSNGLIQIIIITGLLICSGLTMFFFLSTLIGKKPYAVLVGSLFYMLCIFFVTNIFSLVVSWAHAFLPLILALFIKLLQKRVKGEPSGKLLVGFLLAFTVFMSFLADNPSILIVGLLSLLVAFVYVALTQDLLKSMVESIKIVALGILVSLWWLVPLALSAGYFVGVTSGETLNISIASIVSTRSSFLNVFWFNPSWQWIPEYYPYMSYYSNSIIIVATFVPILTTGFVLLFKRRDKVMQYLFFSTMLLSIFITKGFHPPLEQINAFLSIHIPDFSTLFREPEDKFALMIALFAAPLIACTVDSIITAVNRYSFSKPKLPRKVIPISIVAVLILSIVISAGPMFLNNVAETQNPQIPFSSYVNVPSYWNQVGTFFSKDNSDYKILVAPDDPYPYQAYTWGYWGWDSVPTRFIQKPVLYNTYDYPANANNDALNLTYQALEKDDFVAFNNLLSCQNVKYILLRHDLVWNFSTPPAIDPAIVQSQLDNDSSLEYIRSIGQLDIYEYKNWAPSHFIASTSAFDNSTSSLLTQFSPVNNNAVKLSYTKLSPSEYKVHINATQPFYLFFSEAFDSDWKIAGANSEWYSIPFSGDLSENHTVAFGFGNSWYINKTGSYDITVFYQPESYQYYAIIGSGVSLGLLITYEIIQFARKRKNVNQ